MQVLSAAELWRMPVAAVVDRLLLGFDVRPMEGEKRISVDAQDSPSAFDILHLERPDWTGPVQGLWDDKTALEAALAAQRDRISGRVRLRVIAVTVLLNCCSPSNVDWTDRAVPTNPREVGDQWRFLGFDVADPYLESAITMLDGREAKLRLNEFMLIDDQEIARDVRDMAVRAHAQQSPFCIYEIWEVR